MNLFQLGDFTLRSGAESKWKIECDAFTDNDWEALAVMAAEILPPFTEVLGVPRGGLPFAAALQKHIRDAPRTLLIAEDVCTTGGSMERFRASITPNFVVPGMWVLGVCVFAREPEWPEWVQPLFSFNPILSGAIA